ncbi:unnamed protein product [Bursaphelenchus okinawaensis]|uniref:glucuronosyltransferase n=1 Tax=Bursaphelenchus okinawaensis TaxID=465554 RepID=A0A811KB06_9BILA|nr:unnamed protein product [Bursaphelenchus okinawaensis]CAG9096432.1 unnamed protein product [Bursaphelenchus okinawaensis]
MKPTGLIILLAITISSEAGHVFISPSSLEPVHRQTMKPLAEELIKRGHQVTWFEYGLKKPTDQLPSKVKQIYVQVPLVDQSLYDLYVRQNHSDLKRQWDSEYWNDNERRDHWIHSVKLCDTLLSSKKDRAVFDQLVDTKFDAVVIDDLYNPCGLIHTALQKSVFVYYSITGLRTESAWSHHSPSPPSYIPAPGSGLTEEMDFFERSRNLLQYSQNLYTHHRVVLPLIDGLTKKHFGSHKLHEAFYMERNASLNFVNHFPIFDFARPYMPRVNFVGCTHCRKAQGLEKKYSDFISTANEENGFIVISSGHSSQWKHAPQDVVDNLLAAIKSKPNIKFIFQYDGTLKNAPKNLITSKWLPLQDLLGHKLCKAHISHGGLNSIMESVWHGVPVIGWPLNVNNKDNLLRVTARHAGLMLSTKRPAEKQIVSALNRIYVQSFKDEALIFQDMVTDVPYTELTHAAFWVEFIIRHQEIPHARSGADDLNILQYFLVDVIAFLLSSVFIIVYIIHHTIRLLVKAIVWGLVTLWRLAFNKKPKVDKKKKTN